VLPHKLAFFLLLFIPFTTLAQKQKPPAGGRLAIVVDERLAALRATPQLTGSLVRRLSRGRLGAVRSMRTSPGGITFFLVNVSSRTHGWIQRESVVSRSRTGDDRRLLDLIHSSEGFDRISRARLYLDHFARSPMRPEVLLLLGDTAEEAAEKLSKSASRRMNRLGNAPEFAYYLNYTGLDRYNRLRITYIFDQSTKRFHYDGAAWREVIRRYSKSPEAAEARKRLETLYSQLRTM
jgi:hypothetical protein